MPFIKTAFRALATAALVATPFATATADTVNFDIELEVTSPLSLTKLQDMEWGRIEGGVLSSTVELDAFGAGCFVFTGDAFPSTPCQEAQVTVEGPGGQTVTITHTDLTDIGGVAGLDLTFADTFFGTLVLSGFGLPDTIGIGGVLTVPLGAQLPNTTITHAVDISF